jgi:hypothetical protein
VEGIADALQLTLVGLDHADVAQVRPVTDAVCVASASTKLNPVTVIDACPDGGELRAASDTTGASKVNLLVDVPVVEATVIAIRCSVPWPFPTIQITLVPVNQLAVVHWLLLNEVEAVKSEVPKFKPVTVTLRPPLAGQFSCWYDAIGASKVNTVDSVPATALIVTWTIS